MTRGAAVPWILLSLACLRGAGARAEGPDPCAGAARDALALGEARAMLAGLRAMGDGRGGRGGRGSPDHLALNNAWMRFLKAGLQQQGVASSLVLAEGRGDGPPPPAGALNLVLRPDPGSENPAARRYARLATRLGAGSVTVSVVETGPPRPEAFFRPDDLRVEIGPQAALRMLEGRRSVEELQVFRRLMFERRRRRGVRSVFDLGLHIWETTPPSLFGHRPGEARSRLRPSSFRFERLYHLASNAALLAGRLDRIDPDRLERAAEHLDETLGSLGSIARNVQRVLEGVLEHFDETRHRGPWSPGRAFVILPPSRGEDPSSSWEADLLVPVRLVSPVGDETRKSALRRVVAEALGLASGMRERAAAARSVPFSFGGKRRAARELLLFAREADRRTMTGPREGAGGTAGGTAGTSP